MFSKILRIFGLFILTLLLLCCVYFGKLYSETTAAFENLKPEIIQAHDPSRAALFIRDVLFDETRNTQAKPAELIARAGVDTPPGNMFRYQMKKTILAYRLKAEFRDDKILSYWLSAVYFGAGEYGLENAAKSLFNKKVDALTHDELISLAALIRHPRLRNDSVRWEKERNKLKDGLRKKGVTP